MLPRVGVLRRSNRLLGLGRNKFSTSEINDNNERGNFVSQSQRRGGRSLSTPTVVSGSRRVNLFETDPEVAFYQLEVKIASRSVGTDDFMDAILSETKSARKWFQVLQANFQHMTLTVFKKTVEHLTDLNQTRKCEELFRELLAVKQAFAPVAGSVLIRTYGKRGKVSQRQLADLRSSKKNQKRVSTVKMDSKFILHIYLRITLALEDRRDGEARRTNEGKRMASGAGLYINFRCLHENRKL